MKSYVLVLFTSFLLTSCIGDDFIDNRMDPDLRIINSIDSIKLGDSFQFKTIYFNEVGESEEASVNWISSTDTIVIVNDSGVAVALKKGTVTLTATVLKNGLEASDSLMLNVGDTTIVKAPQIRVGTLTQTSTYLLKGSFQLKTDNDNLVLELGSDYQDSDDLPGLYVYLSNNLGTSAGALEVGPVLTHLGAHSYNISNTNINDFAYVLYFCKPFNVKVGHGIIED